MSSVTKSKESEPRATQTSYPIANESSFKGDDSIILHFTGAMSMSETKSKITIVDIKNNKTLRGTRTASAGLSIGNPVEIAIHSTADKASASIKDIEISGSTQNESGKSAALFAGKAFYMEFNADAKEAESFFVSFYVENNAIDNISVYAADENKNAVGEPLGKVSVARSGMFSELSLSWPFPPPLYSPFEKESTSCPKMSPA